MYRSEIQRWLFLKHLIFALPFNSSLLNKLLNFQSILLILFIIHVNHLCNLPFLVQFELLVVLKIFEVAGLKFGNLGIEFMLGFLRLFSQLGNLFILLNYGRLNTFVWLTYDSVSYYRHSVNSSIIKIRSDLTNWSHLFFCLIRCNWRF